MRPELFMQIVWPEVFNEPVEQPFAPDLPKKERWRKALACQLSAYGCSYLVPAPANFGQVMIKLGEITGAFTPDQCHAAFDKWHSEAAA